MITLTFPLILLLGNATMAQSLSSETVLEDLSTQNSPRTPSKEHVKEAPKAVQKEQHLSGRPKGLRKISSESTERPTTQAIGNLPGYALRATPVEEWDNPTVIPKNNDFNNHIEARPGDTLKAVISQNIVVYPGSKAPVTGRVLDGKFKGALVLGEATMDPTTKRANISFKTLRPMKSKDNYNFSGILLAEDGVQGLEGEYESSYWTYFWAETITNTVAGFADATTRKTQTIWGNPVADPGLDPATRQGIAQGLAKTAERLGDRVKNAPEMTTIKGPIVVQITVIQ